MIRTVAAAAATAALAWFPSSASADGGWWDEQTTHDQHAIVNALYENTGHAPPFADAVADGHELATTLTEHGAVGYTPLADGDAAARSSADGAPAAPATVDVATEQARLVTSAGLMPGLEKLGETMAKTAVRRFVVTAIVASEIDLGLYIYAHLSTNEIGEGTAFDYNAIHFYPEGYDFYYGAKSRGEWLFDAAGGWHPVRWFEDPCTFSGFTAPQGARLRTGVATTAQCAFTIPTPPYQDTADVKVDYPYLTREDIVATATLSKHAPGSKPYDYSVSGVAAPPGSEVAELVEEYLDSDEGEELRNQIVWMQGEDGQDPATEPIQVGVSPPETPPTSNRNRWCERTPPGVTDLTVPADEPIFSLFESYPTVAGFDADMRYGSEFRSSKSYTWKNLQGFGLRKIIAKHGWLPIDRAETLGALARSPEPPSGAKNIERGRFTFKGAFYDIPDPSRVSAGLVGRCQRVVVVDTHAVDGEPAPKGIVTSYGKFVEGA